MMNSSTVWGNSSRLRFFITYSNDGDRQGNRVAENMFVGAENLTKWDRFVDTWVAAMRHPRYLRVNGRPVFKMLIPSNYLDWQCGRNGSLANTLFGRLRARAQAAGVGNPIIGGGWHNPSIPIPTPAPAPRPVVAGYMRYPDTFVNCSGGCALQHFADITNATRCMGLCNSTAGCAAVTVGNSGCTLDSGAGPGAPRAGVDVWVRVPPEVRYDWTGTYNDAVPVCPQPHPTEVCQRYVPGRPPGAFVQPAAPAVCVSRRLTFPSVDVRQPPFPH